MTNVQVQVQVELELELKSLMSNVFIYVRACQSSPPLWAATTSKFLVLKNGLYRTIASRRLVTSARHVSSSRQLVTLACHVQLCNIYSLLLRLNRDKNGILGAE